MSPRPGPVALDDPSAAPRLDPSGPLVAGVVQDRRDGRVLMVGWLDAEALAATLEHGEVHFHSRSRGRLWRKGERSGHVLRLRDLAVDCDGDALLLAVDPVGPTCHRGTRSCFDADGAPAAPGEEGAQGFAWLETLWVTIGRRLADPSPESYTARLVAGGTDRTGRKVAEEAVEVLLAAKQDERTQAEGADRTAARVALAGEAADLLYHALVLLAERGLPPAAVIGVLRERHEAGAPGG